MASTKRSFSKAPLTRRRRRTMKSRKTHNVKRRKVYRKRTFKTGNVQFARRFRKRRTKKAKRYTTTRMPPAFKPRDHCIRKLETNHFLCGGHTFGNTGGNTGTVGLSCTVPSDYWYFSMNNCYSPGVYNAGNQAFTFPVPDGFNELTRMYNYWQVKSAKISITIKELVNGYQSSAEPEEPRIIFGLAPLSNRNHLTTGNLTWDQWQLQPGFKQFDIGNVAGEKPLKHVSQFCTVAKTEGTNHISTDIICDPLVCSSYVGSCIDDNKGVPVIVIPSLQPHWWLMAYTPDADMLGGGINLRYSISVKMVFYTEWYSRKIASYVTPTFPLGPPAQLTREDSEMKEEDHFFRPDTPNLSNLSLSTPTITKGWTCLNPQHPKTGHERVKSCL